MALTVNEVRLNHLEDRLEKHSERNDEAWRQLDAKVERYHVESDGRFKVLEMSEAKKAGGLAAIVLVVTLLGNVGAKFIERLFSPPAAAMVHRGAP